MNDIRAIWLAYTPVFRNLQYLSIESGNITDEGAQTLLDGLPHTVISLEREGMDRVLGLITRSMHHRIAEHNQQARAWQAEQREMNADPDRFRKIAERRQSGGKEGGLS